MAGGEAARREKSARLDPATPTGFRVPDSVRFELLMSGNFRGEPSLQAVLEMAVDEYLQRERKKPGFVDAVEAAADARARAADNVTPLRGPSGGDAG